MKLRNPLKILENTEVPELNRKVIYLEIANSEVASICRNLRFKKIIPWKVKSKQYPQEVMRFNRKYRKTRTLGRAFSHEEQGACQSNPFAHFPMLLSSNCINLLIPFQLDPEPREGTPLTAVTL
jgi:hypothetical protein